MKTKLIAILLVCTCALFASSEAEAPTKFSLAERLLVAMDIPAIMEQTNKLIKEIMPMQMQQMGLSQNEDPEQFKKKMDRLMDFVSDELSWEKIKEDYIVLYVDTYDEDELQGAIDFYESPIGKAFIKKQPEIMLKSQDISKRQMTRLFPRIQQKVQELMQEEDLPKQEG
ncbi:DUF2059 domain-containing protein [bacterium]|nr:DUF2059 domain-containing protein [bacterium]